MKTVSKDNIINLFVFLDDTLAKEAKTGRRPALGDNEVLTILIWAGLTESPRTLRAVYNWIVREYAGYFRLPAYKNFVLACHRILPLMAEVLSGLLATKSPLRFADSTMIAVCRNIRSDRHRVAKDVAKWGKNWQGWHYGFKLHIAIDHQNRLCAAVITGANEHDNQVMGQLVNEHTRVLVGDTHYGGSVQRRKLWQKYGIVIVAPAQIKQKKGLYSQLQLKLLRMRPKVEAVFGLLKQKFSLVSSYPRSVNGYFVHYLRVLLGYQMGAVS